MANTDYFPLAALVEKIAGMCAQGISGTAVLISDDNRLAQVQMLEGAIVFVGCRGRRGRDALGIMRTMKLARFNLEPGSDLKGVVLDLPTQTVLDYLSGELAELPAKCAGGEVPRAAAPVSRMSAPTDTPAVLSPVIKAKLEGLLAEYIGPMAAIVCDEHCGEAGDIRSLAHALAKEIPAPDGAARFEADVARVLRLNAL